MAEDLRQRLLAAFEIERSEHVDAMRAALTRARAGETIDIREIFRRAHTLKGASRAVNLPAIESAAHELEALFAAANQDGALGADAIGKALTLINQIEAPAPAPSAPGAPPLASPATEVLRVDAGQLKRTLAAMHEHSGELLEADTLSDQLSGLRSELRALADELQKAQRAIAGGRRADAPLAAAARRQAALARQADEAERAHQQTRWTLTQTAGRLHDEIARLAMAPAHTIFAGLEPMLHDLAREAGLEIEARIEGLEVEADRALLQALRDPIMHLLRNAIAHGLEPAAERLREGKPARGVVGLSLEARDGQLLLKVFDDGRGPDLARIERTATQRGMLSGRNAFGPSAPEDVLLGLVFAPAFSTAQAVDRLSGRGMGLSVVAEAARAAGGGVVMRRGKPWGTEVALWAPLSAARQPMVFIEDQGLFAIPTRALERIIHAWPADLDRIDGRAVLMLGTEGNKTPVPILPFQRLTGAAAARDPDREDDRLTIAILHQDGLRLGLVVERVLDARAVTTAQLDGETPELVSGATQLERGEIAVILNPEVIFQRHARGEYQTHTEQAASPQQAPKSKTILVVDDSITTRTLEKTILEGQGYRVIVSVDGLDALSTLRAATQPIDLIIADIEMPRMDGFQLLQALKADAQLSAIPIIMMTSRADPEDIRRGLDLGADAYLVKQRFDQRELLTTVGQLL